MPQVSCTVKQEILDEILEISTREQRTLSSAAGLLLTQAVKERIRQRNKGKKREKKGANDGF